jgi:hypothetical protein
MFLPFSRIACSVPFFGNQNFRTFSKYPRKIIIYFGFKKFRTCSVWWKVGLVRFGSVRFGSVRQASSEQTTEPSRGFGRPLLDSGCTKIQFCLWPNSEAVAEGLGTHV